MTGDMADCRHCDCTIERIAAGWVDERGFFACVKAPLESIGHGKPAGFVLHEPMPGGLRGAPGGVKSKRHPDEPTARADIGRLWEKLYGDGG